MTSRIKLTIFQILSDYVFFLCILPALLLFRHGNLLLAFFIALAAIIPLAFAVFFAAKLNELDEKMLAEEEDEDDD